MIDLASPVIDSGAALTDHRIVGVLNAGIRLGHVQGLAADCGESARRSPLSRSIRLLIDRKQLIRHPCPASDAGALPFNDFSDAPEVLRLLAAPDRRTATFRDPLRASGGQGDRSLAVAGSAAVIARLDVDPRAGRGRCTQADDGSHVRLSRSGAYRICSRRRRVCAARRSSLVAWPLAPANIERFHD